IGEECMENVGEQEFLMLLFVVHAQFDPAQGLGMGIIFEQPLQMEIDMLAKAENLIEGRSRERRAQALLGKCRKTLVIAVEQPMKIRIEGLVSGQKLTQNEGLKEPGGMGKMPLGGRGFR